MIISATRAERLRWPLAALLALALASCGGSGGGSAEQAPPPPRSDPETQPGGGEPTPAVAAPTGIMITTAARALTVSWSPVAGAAGYRVQWKSGDETYGADREAAAAGTSYTIPSLTAGRQYTVRVLAVPPGGGASAASMEMAAAPAASLSPSTPPPAPQPVSATAPTGIGVTAAVQGLTVSWSAAAGAASYKVQWKSGSQSYSTEREAAVAGTTTSHTLSSLIPGRTYTVRVSKLLHQAKPIMCACMIHVGIYSSWWCERSLMKTTWSSERLPVNGGIRCMEN